MAGDSVFLRNIQNAGLQLLRHILHALEPHLGHIPAGVRPAAELAIFSLVQAAWRLDAVGDTGNRADVETAFRQFGEALDAVGTAYAP